MFRLYLVRHAADVDLPGGRVISPHGRRRFRRAARAFAALEEALDLICTSSRPHALQTAELLAAELGRDDVVPLGQLHPRAAAPALLGALAERLRDGEGVALVGHKRQLGELASALGVRRRHLKLRKGCIARIDVDSLARPRLCIARFRIRAGSGALEKPPLQVRKAS